MSFSAWLPSLLRRGRYFFHVPLGSCQLQPLHHSWCQKKSTSAVQHNCVNSPTMNQTFKTPTDALSNLYSSEQQSAILQVLNTASERELSAIKLLQGRKSVGVIEHREKYGPFQNLQSLLNVPLFQYKTVIKVCNFILNPSEKGDRRERKIQDTRPSMRFIKPEIERERLKTVDSIVSVVFGTRKIAWAHVDRNLVVHDWQQEKCGRFMKGTYIPAVYLEEISSVVSKIPEADLYILEKNGLPAQNTNLFPITLHLRTVEAMLYALLQKTFTQGGQHKVLSMARSTVGKHFGLMVGDSRSSGMDLVKQFLLQSIIQEQPRLSFSRNKVVHYRNLFSSVSENRHEEMCDSLLQALAFYELILNNTT
ncbi:transcription elongation factor, mitochondrial [Malaclemys terrapin pileata]|uniref:transcription elongation factor, mitochondrial n=1 Tax=Malaclemys terrapin pileata TaxID=2991368 RepID=UPI0023A7AD5D|nr:transcription elongation factor, mitochondrial [Malaclemys terrapin pileata]